MGERDFDAEIAAVDEQLNAMLEPMAQAAEAWLQLLVPWTQGIWANVVRAIIAEPGNAARIANLRDHDLRALRRASDAVIDGAEDSLRQTLIDGAADDWPHLKPQTTLEEFATDSSFRTSPFGARNRTGRLVAPADLYARTRHALGAIAGPFAAAGFALPGSFRHDRGNWEVTQAPEWTDAMSEAIDAYAELHTRLIELIGRRIELLREATVAAAQARWDAAAS